MTKNSSFVRKIIYLCGIAILFVPVSILSAPATSREQGGGVLSKMRREYRLSPGQLGKIDPASTAMSLATLGMRGVAATLLWEQANEYKKKDNFDGFKAAANQLAKLQPNFVSVWQFQAWNIAYNISVEFDNFEHRYHWVKKGVDYLIEGTEYNENEPLLLWDAGWFFGHKMGRADEYKQFRRMFRDDTEFHEGLPIRFDRVRGPDSKPDNWLVAREWFLDAQQAVDMGAQLKRMSSAYAYMDGNKKVVTKKQTAIRGKNPLVFHSDPPKALINYADGIEEDGYLDEKALLAWRDAARAWNAYGDRDLVSTRGQKLRLNDQELAEADAKQANEDLEALLPGLREQLIADRQASLSEEDLALLAKPVPDLTEDDYERLRVIRRSLEIDHFDVAAAAPEDKKAEAKQLASLAYQNEELVDIIERYRGIVNFLYWQSRCEAEQEDNTLEARKMLKRADEAYEDADLEGARELYEQTWKRWDVVFERHPLLVDDVEGEDVMEAVVRYKELLAQLDEPFPPADFLLMELLDEYAFDYDIELPPRGPGEAGAPANLNEEDQQELSQQENAADESASEMTEPDELEADEVEVNELEIDEEPSDEAAAAEAAKEVPESVASPYDNVAAAFLDAIRKSLEIVKGR